MVRRATRVLVGGETGTGRRMGGIIRKALNVLQIPPSNRQIAKQARRLRQTRKTPVFALAARLFVAGAFVIGQPVIAEPTPDTSVHASDAFAALQDFVQTQRVVSLNLLQPTSGEPAPQARDPYSVLNDFVRVADASGWVPPVQAQGAAPDDAIHAGFAPPQGPLATRDWPCRRFRRRARRRTTPFTPGCAPPQGPLTTRAWR